jgi:hypothetical protein
MSSSTSKYEQQITVERDGETVRYRIDWVNGEDNLGWYSESLDSEGDVIDHDTHDLAEVMVQLGGSPDPEASDYNQAAGVALEMHRDAIDFAEDRDWQDAASRLKIEGEVATGSDWS